MGLFGHKGWLSKIDNGIDKGFHEANKVAKKIFGDNSWYIGTDAPGGIALGNEAEQIMASKLPYGGAAGGKAEQIPQTKPTQTKPQGYSRTTAATAKDIAQGGMTKDEVIAFNIKHPNETAQGVNK